MAFNPNEGRAEYTATGGQTDFIFNFKIFTTADIEVYQTPIGQVPDDTADKLTLTTDYTVIIDGDNGGTVTLNTGATNGDSITLERNLAITRATEYQTSGDFIADTVNDDQDYQTYLVGDRKSEVDRAIKIPKSVQGFSVELPTPEANKIPAVNSAGTAFEFLNKGATLYQDAFIVDNITDMLSVDTSVYGTVNIRGYNSANDGGGGLYNWDSSTDKSTANGTTIVDPSVSIPNQGTGTGVGCWILQQKWRYTDNDFVFTNPTGARIFGSTSDGADTGALAIGAGGSESSTRGAVLNLYGEQHATWPGEAVLTPVTDASLGRVSLESRAQTRRGLVVNGRWALTPGGYDLKGVADPGGSLVVYGDAGTLGTDPSLTGFTASATADLAVFEQKTSTNGITIATENNVAGRVVFADPDNALSGQIIYDHSDDSMQFTNINGETVRILSNGVVLVGKSSSDVNTDGVELNDDGLIQCTNTSSLVARFNLRTSLGAITEYRFNGNKIGSVSAKDGNYIKVEYGNGGPFDTAGPGTPEGAITAPVGSTYRRTDGGASTTFYVKESGTGNTGWVAK